MHFRRMTAGEGDRGTSRPWQQRRAPALEPLERRLMLSADIGTIGPVDVGLVAGGPVLAASHVPKGQPTAWVAPRAAGPDEGLLVAASASAGSAYVFDENARDVQIPDADGWVYSTCTTSGAPAGSTITEVRVYVEIRHTWIGDLEVNVDTDPTTAIWTIHNRTGAGADDIVGPFINTTDFDELSPNRTWKLGAKDHVGGDTGYIDRWIVYAFYVGGAQPDLVGTSFSASPDRLPANGQTTVSFAVQNQGAAAVGDFTVEFRRSNDDTIAADDPLLGSRVVGGLAAGATYRSTISLDLPEPDPYRSDNQYWVGMIIKSPPEEGNDANNSNQGPGLDKDSVSSEHDLPSPATGGVLTTNIVLDTPLTRAIGDEWIGDYDVDLFEFVAPCTCKVGFDIDRPHAGTLDSTIQLYDSSWVRRASNDNGAGPLPESSGYDAYLSYNVTAGQRYYLAVRGKNNSETSDPRYLTGRSAGSTGGYDLTVAIVPPDLVGTNFRAAPAYLPADGQVAVDFAVTNQGPGSAAGFTVHFYRSDDHNISAGDTYLDSRTVGYLGIGATYSGSIDLDLREPDPYLTDNQYWLGMIIRPALGEAVVGNNSNQGPGADMDDVGSEKHLPRPTDGTTVLATTVGVDTTISGAIGDEWIGAYDIDVFQFTAADTYRVGFDIDQAPGSTLDSYIQLYNSSWTQEASNDNGVGPGESRTTDSYLAHDVTAGQTYYLAVRGQGSGMSDPRMLANRSVGSTGAYDLTVSILRPDLVGSGFAMQGGSPYLVDGIGLVEWAYEVKNQGAGDATSYSVRFYLSEDEIISTTVPDMSFGFQVHYGPLAAGATRVDTMSFGLPRPADPYRTDNHYWIGMVIEPAPYETNTANNSNQGQFFDMDTIASEHDLPSPCPLGNTTVNAYWIGLNSLFQSVVGDEWIGAYDIDVFEFEAPYTCRVGFDIDRPTGGPLDSYIQLYSETRWGLLASNDNGTAPGEVGTTDSYLAYDVTAGHTYYLAVRGAGSGTSDPRSLTGRLPGSTGDYGLRLTIVPPDLLGTSFFTDPWWLYTDGKTTAEFRIENQGAGLAGPFTVDFYLSDDDIIFPGDTYLATHSVSSLAAGGSYTGSIDLDLPVPDPYRTDNKYWVGMVINKAPGEVYTGNNFNRGYGWDMSYVVSEWDLPSPTDGTVTATAIELGESIGSHKIGDEWIGAYDIDLFEFIAPTTCRVGFDIDWHSGSTLDSYIQLYEPWIERASNDNGVGPEPESGAGESYLEYDVVAGHTYYLAVRGKNSGNSPPWTLADRLPATSTGAYWLTVAPVPDLVGTSFIATPEYLPANGKTTVDFDVKNQGGGPATSVVADFYLSDDNDIDPGSDIPLGTRAAGALAAGATYSDSILLDLPDPDPYRSDNEYWVGMVIRPAPGEVNIANNSNQGQGRAADMDSVASEHHLPSPADGVNVLATPLGLNTPVPGDIGDEWIGAYDIDVYEFTAPYTCRVGFDVDQAPGSTLDSYIELFWPGEWAQLAWNDVGVGPGPEPGAGDPYLEFDVFAGWKLYLVVFGNGGGGDPRYPGFSAGSTGAYNLTVTVVPPDLVTMGFVVDSHTVEYDGWADGSFVIKNQGAGPAASPVVGLYLSDDETITSTVPDTHLGDRGTIPLGPEEAVGYDFSVTLPAPDPYRTDNQYWIGMIIDGVPGEVNTLNNSNQGPGVDMDYVVSEAHLPSPCLPGNTTVLAEPVLLNTPIPGDIGDEWIGAYDIDVFKFTAPETYTVGFDIDRGIHSALDSYIQLYDSSWALLASNDDGAGPGAEPSASDSYLAYTVTGGEEYYLAVRGHGRGAGDPRTLTGRLAGTTGAYDLTVSIVPPDLTGAFFCASAYGPGWLLADGYTQGQFIVANQGPGDAASCLVDLYLSDDEIITDQDMYLDPWDLGPLAAGTIEVIDFGAYLPTPDPYRTDNEYWVGMIIRPAPGEVNTLNNSNEGRSLDRDHVSSEADLPMPVDGVTIRSARVLLDTPILGITGVDEWIGAYDIDVFEFEAPDTCRVGFDIDQHLLPPLDSFIQLYSGSPWGLLASNDNGAGPAPETSADESYLEWDVIAGQTYYLAVRGAGSGTSDPRTLEGRLPSSTGGGYYLTLTVVPPGPNVDVWLIPRIAPTSPDMSTTLPPSDRDPDPFWQIETCDYFAEVWVRSDQASPAAISGGSVTVTFDPDYAQVVSVDHASVFTLEQVETIDNATGVVSLGGEALATDMGDDEYVCLGRVLFQGVAPVDEVAHEAGPYDMALNADAGTSEFELIGAGLVDADIQPVPGVDIRANIYDIDDNGQVAFNDFTYFAPAYGHAVGQGEPPFFWWADFDRNGQVEFNDFTYFAPAYGKPFCDPTLQFPASWHTTYVTTGAPQSTACDALAASDEEADMKVLTGDFDADGRVSSRDRRELRGAYGSAIGDANYAPLVDLNVDGRISSRDRRILRDSYGTALSGPPAAATPSLGDTDSAAFAAAAIFPAALTDASSTAPIPSVDDASSAPSPMASIPTPSLDVPPFVTSTPSPAPKAPSPTAPGGTDAPPTSQLEPDLSAGLTDPYRPFVIRVGQLPYP